MSLPPPSPPPALEPQSRFMEAAQAFGNAMIEAAGNAIDNAVQWLGSKLDALTERVRNSEPKGINFAPSADSKPVGVSIDPIQSVSQVKAQAIEQPTPAISQEVGKMAQLAVSTSAFSVQHVGGDHNFSAPATPVVSAAQSRGIG